MEPKTFFLEIFFLLIAIIIGLIIQFYIIRYATRADEIVEFLKRIDKRQSIESEIIEFKNQIEKPEQIGTNNHGNNDIRDDLVTNDKSSYSVVSILIFVGMGMFAIVWLLMFLAL